MFLLMSSSLEQLAISLVVAAEKDLTSKTSVLVLTTAAHQRGIYSMPRLSREARTRRPTASCNRVTLILPQIHYRHLQDRAPWQTLIVNCNQMSIWLAIRNVPTMSLQTMQPVIKLPL